MFKIEEVYRKWRGGTSGCVVGDEGPWAGALLGGGTLTFGWCGGSDR